MKRLLLATLMIPGLLAAGWFARAALSGSVAVRINAQVTSKQSQAPIPGAHVYLLHAPDWSISTSSARAVTDKNGDWTASPVFNFFGKRKNCDLSGVALFVTGPAGESGVLVPLRRKDMKDFKITKKIELDLSDRSY